MRPRCGFTLLEMLAVVLLTSLVIGVALSHYINLGRATERASRHSEGARRAVALLDRVSRDFESAILMIKPAEVDPNDYPWIFSGEQRYSELGADQLKFVTLSHHPRSSLAHESDLVTVVYCLRADEDGQTYRLLRWSSPQLPGTGSELRRMPCEKGDGARLLTDGLSDFGVVFFDDTGSEAHSWDSSQLTESSSLPSAVKIEVAFAGDLPAETEEGDLPQVYARTVPIRVKPLDPEELNDPNSPVNGGSGEEGGDEDDASACQDTPCAGQNACAVIGCASKIGQFGASADAILRGAMSRNLEFCAWRGQVGGQLRGMLIDNAACR